MMKVSELLPDSYKSERRSTGQLFLAGWNFSYSHDISIPSYPPDIVFLQGVESFVSNVSQCSR